MPNIAAAALHAHYFLLYKRFKTHFWKIDIAEVVEEEKTGTE